MAATRRADAHEIKATQRATGTARTIADSLPRLILEARKIAATVIHGAHGRKRAGPGEQFWQYRRFMSGEPARQVDWRRSARDGVLYVREQEWEASHTVWIWPDRSPSMVFTSHLAQESKLDRTLVVAFALAEVLVHGGSFELVNARETFESMVAGEKVQEAISEAKNITPISEVAIMLTASRNGLGIVANASFALDRFEDIHRRVS